MENASKALLIATEILIGVIILTIMALLFSRMLEVSDSYQTRQEAQKIITFNVEYQRYETEDNADKDYLTSEEVVSLVNKVLSWNRSTQDPDEKIKLSVDETTFIIEGTEEEYRKNHIDKKDLIDFMIKSKKYDKILEQINNIETKALELKKGLIDEANYEKYLKDEFDEIKFTCHIEYKEENKRVGNIVIETIE